MKSMFGQYRTWITSKSMETNVVSANNTFYTQCTCRGISEYTLFLEKHFRSTNSISHLVRLQILDYLFLVYKMYAILEE